MIEEKIKEEILNSVAPCSMFCSTCTGCQYGDISNHSKELLKLLEGHEEFLEKNLEKQYFHKLEEFRTFRKKLEKYAYPKCGGCRNDRAAGCSIKQCFILECTKKYHVNFCADCSRFPCDKVNKSIFKESTIQKWLNGNKKIREVGIDQYYYDGKNIPHYINYQKKEKMK